MMARIVFPRLFWFGSKEFSMRYLLVQKRSYVKPPNGMAHLPPIIAKQLTLETIFSAKWPPHIRAEGGQVEPVLGRRVATERIAYFPYDPFWFNPRWPTSSEAR
jgi:hypothetical protein